MFSKIAINNVKRSFKDYFIYFITLTFAVCIFYSFNSIEAQNSMLEMGKSTTEFMSTLNTLIAGASVFVAFILGGLIAYANNFLIKKRKRELGIYMTLGMSKGKISRILIIETILIGLISLIIGIVLGIIVSQGLSILTAKLLAVSINQYKFIISVSAVIKSALYFGIIFILVMILNQRTISKYKLIDMLNASKRNEKIKLNNPLLSIVVFFLSIAMLVGAYILILKVGLETESILFLVSIMMGIIGTLLFFFSLSNFFINIVQKNRKVYFKNLNIFVLRQVNNKINTNFLSMTVICLMIFLTITLLFTMFSFKGSYDKMIKGNTSFDGTIQLFINQEDQKVKDIKEYMDIMDFKYNDYEKQMFFNEYKLNITINDLLSEYLTKQEKKDFAENYIDGPVSTIKVSEYNSILELKGQSPITLSEEEVLVVSNYEQMNNALSIFMENEDTINIDNKIFTIKNEVPIKENIVTTGSYLNFFYLVVPDQFSGELSLYSTGFNIMFEENDPKQSEETFSNFLNEISENVEYSSIEVIGNTIELVHLRVYGSTTMIVFLGVYLGIVFLVSSAAVLALQQLSDISDSLDRYKSLKKIGVTNKLINKAILQQNLIYFMIPLSLAIIDSIVGMIVINKIFSAYNSSLIGSSSLMISLALAIIYGGYFYATYVSSKNIVRNSN
ncbi:putative ABC transport system permease protein [Alkalibaculum bacchi]|uniref:Putative ABC transport system permease protein n=1 Tax=Alkalibaculum bacchi TaxID=645887 RepID=A0A366I925_9FIRM|nr:FtsX-like permease family protein [Alkalibaculum bacchi]RBP66037.1 putative ABC transport system permease protein [Alkalibaculum bacchi]